MVIYAVVREDGFRLVLVEESWLFVMVKGLEGLADFGIHVERDLCANKQSSRCLVVSRTSRRPDNEMLASKS